MGWNTSALFVRDRTVDEVIGFLPDVFGYEPTGERVDGEQATKNFPRDRLYTAHTGRWCQLWEPDMRFDPDTIIDMDGPGTLLGTRALWVVFAGVSDIHGFTLYDDGDVTRSFVYHQGDVVREQGEPLAVEREHARDGRDVDEDFVWAVIRAVTGLDHDVARTFDVHDVK